MRHAGPFSLRAIFITVAVGLTAFAGCAAPGPKRPEWTRAGETTQELNQDTYLPVREREPAAGVLARVGGGDAAG